MNNKSVVDGIGNPFVLSGSSPPVSDPRSQEFIEWQNFAQEDVEVTYYKDHHEIAKIVTEFRKSHKPRFKECHNNASDLVLFNPDVQFVYGNYELFQMRHSWNSYKGIHFDITNQIATRLFMKKRGHRYSPSKNYCQFFSLNFDQLIQLEIITGQYCRQHNEQWAYWFHFSKMYWLHAIQRETLIGLNPDELFPTIGSTTIITNNRREAEEK